MAWHAALSRAGFAILLCFFLAACATRGPVLSSRSTELVDTPFFPQAKYQCGPAALATLLAATDVTITPDELTPRVYVPGRRGSLQLEMVSAARDQRRLPLVLPRHLDAIVAELEAGRPVLVLHDYGWGRWRRWHYAVVVGYDPVNDVFTLRSGRDRRQRMRSRHFMVYWHHAGRWAMVALRPGETAANDDARLYLESAANFERVADPADLKAVFDAAVTRWPEDAIGWLGRGTAEYRLGNPRAAARDYARALELDPAQAGTRNNLAQTLLDLGCPRHAQSVLGDVAEPATIRVAAVIEATRREIDAAVAQDADDNDPVECRSLP